MKRRGVTALFGVVAAVFSIGIAQAIVLESWEDQIAGSTRWKVLSEFNNEAVLDKETQLVWEKSPDTTEPTWSAARSACANKNVGGRKGWRLPSFAELASLVDPGAGPPTLPAGHPFSNIVNSSYWSATTVADTTTDARLVSFFDGLVSTFDKSAAAFSWCVRGGMRAKAY